jgi:NADPH-dependent curcumin reductase CurA
MSDHLRSGRVKARIDMMQGLDQAGPAMAGMLVGDNIGQRLIQVAPDPTR